jgi:radical SAM superfamily enzyme YgiQ (UPF0313 family)
MRYTGTVIRPPSEANSYILQVTYGCSHIGCTFCGTYLDKPFGVREPDQVYEDIAQAQKIIPNTRRVFLADGDALALSSRRLINILDHLKVSFPELERVGIYANAQNILRKRQADLETLRQKGLKILYLGLESGSDAVLTQVEKGSTASQMIAATQRAKAAGMRVSIIAILGIAGPELSAQHAELTARVVSAMDPEFFSMLSLMLVPGTQLHNQWQKGEFQLLSPEEMLTELRTVIANLEGISHCIFRTNHASNYLPLKGTLPQDKPQLLATLDSALSMGREALRPEEWRGL